MKLSILSRVTCHVHGTRWKNEWIRYPYPTKAMCSYTVPTNKSQRDEYNISISIYVSSIERENREQPVGINGWERSVVKKNQIK